MPPGSRRCIPRPKLKGFKMPRFTVRYRIFADDGAQARQRAEGIAVEQTVEIPRDIVPAGYIEDTILGKVTDIAPQAPGQFEATISYHSDSVGPDLPQLLNVIFGNSSIQQGIKVTGLDVSALDGFAGANFGAQGIRKLCNTPSGPLIAPVLKPMGSSVTELADLAYECACAGAQIIKEDHGLADQPAAPFAKRVEKIAQAVARANAKTGGRSLYFPCLSGPFDSLLDRARHAREAGADGLLILPGLTGYDLALHLSRQPDPLPLMAHPSFLGPYVLNETCGFTHGMMFGILPRLAGIDISVFPNVGGRFGFTAAECADIVTACRDPQAPGAPILPSPGGGMSPERTPEMIAAYGEDSVFLLGGSILRDRSQLGTLVRQMRAN